MAPDRVINAIDSLIAHIIPTDAREDEYEAQERHNACFQIVKKILDGPASPAISSDVNHASDLIKRKLIQSNPSQALRFSNLYSRLLALPVLDHKWAILYLLYQLADSPDPDEPLPISPVKPSAPNYRDAIKRHGNRSKNSTPILKPDEEQFRDAFQTDGLKRFPPKETKQKDVGKEKQQEAITLRRDVSLKSTLLSSNRSEMEPSESGILRDLPFTLQGVSSTTLPFEGKNTIRLPPTLPLPVVSLLHTLAEPSLLYRQLDEFSKSSTKGLLSQSLRSAISSELRSYLSLIAALESQIRRALSSMNTSDTRGGIGKTGVTLKRCVVWTREATMGLRLMSLMAEESESTKGGQLISLVHKFSSSHGDPVVAAFAERLLGNFTRPFYDILRHWIYDGELSDPYQEFFVREQQQPKTDPIKLKAATNVWEDKYEIAPDMVPSVITQDFAQKVFLIGKSLNFLRHSCGDAAWVEEYSKAASKQLQYGDTAKLEVWIDEAYKTTMKRVIDLMANKFHLFEHLQGLKRYMLLGQGDFIVLLMDSLASYLDRPADVQYRHNLTAQLEHAIRGSNAQYDSSEVLRRLDARMLQLSHGDIGWDCFTLVYNVDAPIDVVVTEWGSRQYLKVFNFLWKIKRVEFAILSTWRKCMTGSRGVLQNSDIGVTNTWKSTRAVLAEMMHFVGQLQYYILFEVIESSWSELQKRVRKEDCTLDDLIQAHTRYLNDITHKGLLGAKRRHQGGDDEDRTTHLAQLSDILRLMLNYRDSVDGLYSWSVSDFTRRQEADVRTTTQHDDDGYQPTGSVASEFPVLQERLRQLGASFKTKLQILLGDLAYQPDVDMRFLGVAMNFNDVYQLSRRKSKPQQTAGTSSANVSRA
ncbi:hypothetical protein S7711_09511 [Stachybotrys chartarum IBT 7711]|uniref:Uncharacterized protein n=1 Tax=Stachybotrys chartarum (strain CBS 109288 / IBT 7711) TaxID=1280523 RepID=A0A084AES1_STACB|nr:hypothetical protein S7711_09511 [Stachybotrys chartarum IBT 7711]KFA46320.1 hypothetical protein S40293_06966 [Stachybotrys chartarum IBT 40293]